MLSVDVPVGVTGLELKLMDAPLGVSEVLKVTGDVQPLREVTVTV